MPELKAQHYIPEFYLKGFTDKEGVICVCEKFKPLRQSKPKEEANRLDYYTHAEQGMRDETAEDELAKLESRAAPVIRRLTKPQIEITPTDAGHLFMFIGFMFVRVPSWREYLDKQLAGIVKASQQKRAQNKEAFLRDCIEFESATKKSLGDHETLRQHLLKGDYEIAQDSVGYNLGAMFRSAFSVLEELRWYGYEVLYAPAGMFFVTSDSPVVTVQPDGMGQASIGVGFGRPQVEVFFPLNKRACLRMERGIEPSKAVISEKSLNQINRTIMACAARYLYSSESHKRIARLFDQCGCKVRPGKESFLSEASIVPFSQ